MGKLVKWCERLLALGSAIGSTFSWHVLPAYRFHRGTNRKSQRISRLIKSIVPVTRARVLRLYPHTRLVLPDPGRRGRSPAWGRWVRGFTGQVQVSLQTPTLAPPQALRRTQATPSQLKSPLTPPTVAAIHPSGPCYPRRHLVPGALKYLYSSQFGGDWYGSC